MGQFEELRLMKRVVHLYYERDLTQNEIAKLLGLSRPKVSRILSEARRRGIVRIHIVDPIESCQDLAALLCRHFGLQEAIVIPSATHIPDMLRQEVGKAAAVYVQSRLQDKMSIGVGWGITVYESVKAMGEMRLPAARVAPLLGGLGQTPPDLQAFELARRLADKVGGTCTWLHAPCLLESAAAREAFLREPSVSEALERARNVDIALVGMDALWKHTSLVKVEAMSAADLTLLDERQAVGQCCCRFYDVNGRMCAPELENRTIGISTAELAHIPLVIGVATALDTVEAILGALRGGFIKVLVSDQSAVEKVLMLEEDRLLSQQREL